MKNVKENNVGFSIRHERIKRGLSQEYVAQEMELSQATMSKIESGNLPLSIKRIRKFCKVLDLDFITFLQSNKILPEINDEPLPEINERQKIHFQNHVDSLISHVQLLSAQNDRLIKLICYLSELEA